MRTLEGSNRVRNGLLGIVVLLIALGVGQSFASVPMLFATPTYYAQFSDTGGINTGDKVRIAGVDVPTTPSSPTPAASTRATRYASQASTLVGCDP